MTEAMRREPKRCIARRRDGKPCSALALGASPYCFAHDPERESERIEARRKGGRNSASLARIRGLLPPRLLPVYETLERALAQVHDGTLEPRRASAMAALARAMVAVLTAGELEERVRALEGKAKEWI